MLFRIQNLYLFIAFICIVCAIVFPFGGYDWDFTFQGKDFHYQTAVDSFGIYYTSGLKNSTEQFISYPFYMVFILLGLLTGATILSYKNRKRQLKVGRFNFLLHIIVLVSFLTLFLWGDQWGISFMADQYNLKNTASILEEEPLIKQYGIGFFALITAIPLIFMANISINRDEKLVQSLDRLR